MKNCQHITRSILCMVALAVSAQFSLAFNGKYPIQNFTPSDYKAGIQNIDFIQNRDMTLFVANNLGVLSYNGNEWSLHPLIDGKKERSLAFDESNNRLYVGSQGAFGYVEENWDYVSLIEKIPESARSFDEVWDVFLLNSKVYFCTFRAIYVFDGESVSVIEKEGGFDRSFLAGGKLFAQNHEGKLFEVKDKKLVVVHHKKSDKQTIAGVIPQGEEYLLFYNSGEIESTSPFVLAPDHKALGKILQGKFVNHVLQLSDARLAISTQTAGVFLYDLQNKTIENITVEDGLLTNACLRSFQDYAGNLWVGMQNGIAFIDINSPMRFVNQTINLQGSGYEAFETEEGTYFTTSNGIYFLGKNTGQCLFLKGTEGPAYGMQKIAGKLYAGHHTGLFFLEKGRAIQLANTDGLWQIKQLRSNPEYAIGGTYAGLHLFRLGKNMHLASVQKIEGFNESSRFFEEDRKGRIWVGQFYKGLYQLNLSADLTGAEVNKVSKNYDFPLDEQLILSRIDNELYLATRAGVFRIDQAQDSIVEAENFADNIGRQHVYSLRQDHQKNIHIYAENLVGFYKQISLNNYAFIPSSLFQLRYFLNNDLLNISINTKEGVLFNSNEGFIHYDPELENRVVIDRPPVLKRVFSVTEDSILYARKPFADQAADLPQITTNYRAKILQFEVESFQFDEINNQQFRYFLKGFDDDFGEWTDATTKEYSNLKEGEYEFVVQTKNYLGKIDAGQPLSIEIKPPFFRSLLAKISYVILGLLSLFLVSKRQKIRYSKKAKEVENRKQRELEKKQLELIEIEKQKEQKLRQLEEDKIKSELRHTNNLLAASTMNLVVKNEFMETIKEELNEVRNKGKNADTKRALEKIVKEIDTTLRLQEDWEQFEYHFDQVHGDFLSRFRNEFKNLSPNEQKLSAFLRLNLNTKDIANLMGISVRGVEIARYRLRKKLDLNKGQNLSKFILEY